MYHDIQCTVGLAYYGVSHTKDWESLDCGTSNFCCKVKQESSQLVSTWMQYGLGLLSHTNSIRCIEASTQGISSFRLIPSGIQEKGLEMHFIQEAMLLLQNVTRCCTNMLSWNRDKNAGLMEQVQQRLERLVS